MSGIQIAHDVVEANGKTIKQNNLELKHQIPLQSLVEYIVDDRDHREDPRFGLRLFVVEHTRDCDGEPLYSLSFKKDWKKIVVNKNDPYSFIPALTNDGMVIHGICESSLKLIVQEGEANGMDQQKAA